MMLINEDGVIPGGASDMLLAIAETAAERQPMTIQGTDYLALNHGERLLIVATLRVTEAMGLQAESMEVRESAFWAGAVADRIERFDRSACGHSHPETDRMPPPPDDTPLP